MSSRFHPIAFAALFCTAYAFVYWENLPLFLYYPIPSIFHFGPAPVRGAEGPAMAWYGLMTSAAVIAGLGSFAVSDRWLARRVSGFIWVFPLAAMLVCVFLLRVFFR